MAKKVTCTLPNASELINGVKFEVVDGVVVADGLEDDVAAQFDGIPGYEIEDGKAETAAEKKAREKAEKAAKDAADKAAAEANKAPDAGAANKE